MHNRRHQQRVRAVLDGLLEEKLLDDPAQLHLALDDTAEAGQPSWVAACDKAWLQVWLTHRTRDTAYSRIGYALGKNADLRDELKAALDPLRQVLSDVLGANLNSP